MRFARSTCIVLVALAWASAGVARAQPADSPLARMAAFERALDGDSENLRLAADYRQVAIAAQQFDRAIDALEKLAKRKGSGPNIFISHALACVDKVPAAGDIRRLYLGRSAMDSLTKSIARRPSVIAYYMRGLINLYYNNFIFKRIPAGIADLEAALGMVTADTPPALVSRIYASSGDGHWRLDERTKAREI